MASNVCVNEANFTLQKPAVSGPMSKAFHPTAQMQNADVEHPLCCLPHCSNIVGLVCLFVLKHVYTNPKNQVSGKDISNALKMKGRVTRTNVSTDTSAQISRATHVFILSLTEYSFKAMSDHMLLNQDDSAFLKNSTPTLMIQKNSAHFIQDG